MSPIVENTQTGSAICQPSDQLLQKLQTTANKLASENESLKTETLEILAEMLAIKRQLQAVLDAGQKRAAQNSGYQDTAPVTPCCQQNDCSRRPLKKQRLENKPPSLQQKVLLSYARATRTSSSKRVLIHKSAE